MDHYPAFTFGAMSWLFTIFRILDQYASMNF
jgi:hypothetical protein